MIASPSHPEPHPQLRLAIPAWITPQLIERTRAIWQPICRRPLTDKEALEIVLNVANLYDVLEAIQ